MKLVNTRGDKEKDLERQVWNLLFQHFQAERRNWSAACREYNLTLPQSHLLRLLAMETPVKMNGLADALDCDASNITGLVDKLETRGLIKRQSDPDDRRVKMITLTQAGLKFRTKLWNRLAQPSPAVTELSLSDKKALHRILKKMVETAQDDRIEAARLPPARARLA